MTKKPFLDHLEDLRWTLLKVAVTLILVTIGMFLIAPQLLKVISWPLYRIAPEDQILLRTLKPASGFIISFKLSFLFGFIVSLPLITYFVVRFFFPALKPKERRFIFPVCFVGGGLFVLGVLFCYFAALPISLKFLWGFSERLRLANEWTIEYYVSFVTSLLLVFGIAFELPIVVMGLVSASILTPEFLRQKRPYAILIILIAAALLTPPDVISQILIGVPMILLYEVCVWSAKYLVKRRAKKGSRDKKF